MLPVYRCIDLRRGRRELLNLWGLASGHSCTGKRADIGWYWVADGVCICASGVRQRCADYVLELVRGVHIDTELRVPRRHLLHYWLG